MTDTTLNTKPTYSAFPDIQWSSTFTAANTAKDGTGTVNTVYTAPSQGGRVDRLKVRAKGTNVATVLRIFINNGQDPTNAANNSLVSEVTIAATTLSEVSALADNDIPMNLPMPAGYKINVTIGTAVAAGLQATAYAGKYN